MDSITMGIIILIVAVVLAALMLGIAIGQRLPRKPSKLEQANTGKNGPAKTYHAIPGGMYEQAQKRIDEQKGQQK